MLSVMKKVYILVGVVLLVTFSFIALVILFPRTYTYNINEIGMKISVPKSIGQISHTYSSTTGTAVFFSTKDLEDRDPNCSSQNVSSGSIWVFQEDIAAQNYANLINSTKGKLSDAKRVVSKLGNLYVVFDGGSNQPCSSDVEVQAMQKSFTERFILLRKSAEIL